MIEDTEEDDDFVRPNCDPAKSLADRCDACGCAANWVAELPRERVYQNKVIMAPPARFRLCSAHAKNLANNSEATVHPIGARHG